MTVFKATHTYKNLYNAKLIRIIIVGLCDYHVRFQAKKSPSKRLTWGWDLMSEKIPDDGL